MTETKNKGGRPFSKQPLSLRKYKRENVPKTEEVLQRNMKLLHEHLKRHEAAIFSPELYNKEYDRYNYSSQLARECKELSTAASNLGNMYLRIQKEGRHAADLMSLDEKLAAIVAFSEELGKMQARKFMKVMYETLHALEGRFLNRKTSQGPSADEALEASRSAFPDVGGADVK